jgi:hypothetical protein
MAWAGVVVLVITGLFVYAQQANATSKIKCDKGTGKTDVATFVGSIDPIVNHNELASMHQHDFFGTKGWQLAYGNAANYDDVRTSATICREAGDTAGYWAPSLVYISGPKAGQRVPVRQFTAYYRGFAGQSKHAGSIAFPPDTRLVALQNSKSYGLVGWTCGQNSAVTGSGRWAIPDCSASSGKGGDTLTAHINFPSCWNGNPPNHSDFERGDTRDNADWAYPTSKKACQSSHPIEVVQLRETIQYHYTGKGDDVALTSDAMSGTSDGQSMHVDFWNTWDQAKLEAMVAKCVQGKPANFGSCAP